MSSLGSRITANKIIGSYINENGKLEYTDDTAEWYDMGIISKIWYREGKYLKKENRKSF